jgi:hypothetical protein
MTRTALEGFGKNLLASDEAVPDALEATFRDMLEEAAALADSA